MERLATRCREAYMHRRTSAKRAGRELPPYIADWVEVPLPEVSSPPPEPLPPPLEPRGAQV